MFENHLSVASYRNQWSQKEFKYWNFFLKNPASFRCTLLIAGLQFKTTFSNHSEVADVWGLLVSQHSFSNSTCSYFSFFTLHYHIAAIQHMYFLMLACSHLSCWRQCPGYLGHVPWTLRYKHKVTLKKLHHSTFQILYLEMWSGSWTRASV